MSFPKFVNMTKNTPFYFRATMYARPLPGLEKQPNYIFFEDDIQLQIQVPPPPRVTQVGSQNVRTLTVGLCNRNSGKAYVIFNYG